MKKIILFVFVLCSSFGFSQENTYYQDIVYLKDGSIINGTVIEQIFNQSVKVRTEENKEIIYSSEDILKIEKKALPKLKWINNFKEKKKGWFIETEGSINISNYFKGFISVTNGYKFNRFAYLGVGLGVGFQDVYRNIAYQEPVLEANIAFSGDILNKRVTPYYQLNAGYSYLPGNKGRISIVSENGVWEDANYSYTGYILEDYGGPFGEVGLGVRIKSLKRIYYKFGVDMRIGTNLSASKSIYYEHALEDILFTNRNYKDLSSFGSFQLRFGIGF